MSDHIPVRSHVALTDLGPLNQVYRPSEAGQAVIHVDGAAIFYENYGEVAGEMIVEDSDDGATWDVIGQVTSDGVTNLSVDVVGQAKRVVLIATRRSYLRVRKTGEGSGSVNVHLIQWLPLPGAVATY